MSGSWSRLCFPQSFKQYSGLYLCIIKYKLCVFQTPFWIVLPPPPSGAFAIHLNMTSEWNEFTLKVAVSVSLNWTLLLEVLLICSDISISSCYPGLVSACASQLVLTLRLDHSVPSR